MPNFRVPRGVYSDELGALGGRFATAAGFLDVASSLDDDSAGTMLTFVGRQLDKAAAQLARLEEKFQDDPKRYGAKTASVERDVMAWQELADALVRTLVEEEEIKEPDYGPTADEWEVGFEYGSAGGESSDFDLSLRMSREDGLPMSERDALNALRAFRDGLRETGIPHEPDGYRFHGINWKRPRSSWRPHGRTGDRSDLAAFAAPLYTEADNDSTWRLRMGAVDL